MTYKQRKEEEFNKKFPNSLWTFEDEWMLGQINYDLHSFYLQCHAYEDIEKVSKWLNSLRERLGVKGNYFL